jgi:predicted DNA binding CopG/RHH family protein
MGRPPRGAKRTVLKRVNYRLSEKVVMRLAKASARKGLNMSEYVEEALLAQLEKDGIR